MRFLFALFLLTTLSFFQCEGENKNSAIGNSEKQQVANQNINTMNSSNTNEKNTEISSDVFNFSGKEGEIEYQFKGILQKKGKHDGITYPNDSLLISYRIKNNGTREFIVFNQGHSSNSQRNIVYVEPQTAGIIELSQRMFEEPTDKMCPSLYVPIVPRGSLLEAKSEISDKGIIELPLKINTPFDACTPASEMPKKSNKVKFCIGIAEKDAKTQLSKEGFANPTVKIEKQKLLCSDYFEIK